MLNRWEKGRKISKPGKNRGLESCSNIFFPLAIFNNQFNSTYVVKTFHPALMSCKSKNSTSFESKPIAIRNFVEDFLGRKKLSFSVRLCERRFCTNSEKLRKSRRKVRSEGIFYGLQNEDNKYCFSYVIRGYTFSLYFLTARKKLKGKVCII